MRPRAALPCWNAGTGSAVADGGRDLAVVIPALDEAECLPATLAALDEGRDLIDEIVLADGGSSDGTLAVAERFGARVVTAPRGRGTQIDAGVAASSAAWLLILHADTVLAPGWAGAVRAAIHEGGMRARYGRLRFASADKRARMVEALVTLRCAIFRLPYGDQALLIPRALLDLAGGMPAIPLMEDVALARLLGPARLAPMAVTAITDAGAYERDGWVRRSVANLWRLGRYLAGARAEALVPRYRR